MFFYIDFYQLYTKHNTQCFLACILFFFVSTARRKCKLNWNENLRRSRKLPNFLWKYEIVCFYVREDKLRTKIVEKGKAGIEKRKKKIVNTWAIWQKSQISRIKNKAISFKPWKEFDWKP
jgi:hypothetical protein